LAFTSSKCPPTTAGSPTENQMTAVIVVLFDGVRHPTISSDCGWTEDGVPIDCESTDDQLRRRVNSGRGNPLFGDAASGIYTDAVD